MHPAAMIRRDKFMLLGAAFAYFAPTLRGLPKNVIPYTFTKAAQAKVQAKATAPISSGKAGIGPAAEPLGRDLKISHSLTKPFRKGKPEMAAQPMRKLIPVPGIRGSRLPI